MELENVLECTRCGREVVVRKMGERIKKAHGSYFVLSCDCSTVPIDNFPEVDTGYWKKKE